MLHFTCLILYQKITVMGLKNQIFKVASAITGGIASFIGLAVFSDLISSGDLELIIGVLSAGGVATAAGYNTVYVYTNNRKKSFFRKNN